MTSKYADKKCRPPCIFCPESATVLTVVKGSPEWMCAVCFTRIEQEKR